MMHCMVGKKKVEEMSEEREDISDAQADNKSLTTTGMLQVFSLHPLFSMTCSFLSKSNFTDLKYIQCEEIAFKIV